MTRPIPSCLHVASLSCSRPVLIKVAIKLALQNEIRRAEEAIPLRERVVAVRNRALAEADQPKGQPLTAEERDALWGS